MTGPSWVPWARDLLPDHPGLWEEWRRRADGYIGLIGLEAALERSWREMTSQTSSASAKPQRAVYAVLDLETGGLDPRTCAICSVAVMTLDAEMNEVTRYHRLVSDEPGRQYWPDAMAVNGLESWRLRRDGIPVARVLDELRAGLPGKVVVGHNVGFDLSFLAARGIAVPESACTLELARRLLPGGSHKLGDVADRLGVRKGKAHDAMGDVETTANVFRKLMRRPTL